MAGSRVMLFVDSLRTGEVARDGDGRWQWEWGEGRRGAVVVCDPTGGLRLERSAPVVLALDPDLVRRPHAPPVTLSLSSFSAAASRARSSCRTESLTPASSRRRAISAWSAWDCSDAVSARSDASRTSPRSCAIRSASDCLRRRRRSSSSRSLPMRWRR